MFLKFLKIFISFLVILSFQFAHSEDLQEMETQTVGNEFFSILIPADWTKDKSRKGIFLIPPENDKGLHISIFNIDNPNTADGLMSIPKDKDTYEILRDEYELSPAGRYRLFDGYQKGTKNPGFRIIHLTLQNRTHLVYLSFGDYACSSKFCSNELISTIESSFVVFDFEGKPLTFKEFRAQFH